MADCSVFACFEMSRSEGSSPLEQGDLYRALRGWNHGATSADSHCLAQTSLPQKMVWYLVGRSLCICHNGLSLLVKRSGDEVCNAPVIRGSALSKHCSWACGRLPGARSARFIICM